MDLEQALDECVALYEAYRRLGFLPDEIFLAYGAIGLGMTVQAQGKQYTMRVTKEHPWPNDQVTARWAQKAETLNSGRFPPEKWLNSMALKHGLQIITELMAEGFILPCTERSSRQLV